MPSKKSKAYRKRLATRRSGHAHTWEYIPGDGLCYREEHFRFIRLGEPWNGAYVGLDPKGRWMAKMARTLAPVGCYNSEARAMEALEQAMGVKDG